jgi:two-component system chemotaxis response regulator CheB
MACAELKPQRLHYHRFMQDVHARMKALHDTGARCIAQNEETCVVFGMPKEAIKLQAVDDILPLEQMARAILQFDARA